MLTRPVIVAPQACILGVGRIVEKPIVFRGQVAVQPRMNLCLSFDHRVLDGAAVGRFLQGVKRRLEHFDASL